MINIILRTLHANTIHPDRTPAFGAFRPAHRRRINDTPLHLADDDLEHITERQRPENKIGFALQLCALRYRGRLLSSDAIIPEKVLRFIAAQLGLTDDDILPYAARRQTRQHHLHALRQIYGFKMFAGQGAQCLKTWLEQEAETASSNDDLARRFVEECAARRRSCPASQSMSGSARTRWLRRKVSRFVWLRQFEVAVTQREHLGCWIGWNSFGD